MSNFWRIYMSEENETIAPQAEVLEPQADEYKDKYLRLLAEMENSRKRMIKEKQEAVRFGIENVLADVIGPMDSLENALKSAENLSGEVKNWAVGFQMILAQFKEALHQHGATPFVSEGEVFDPHFHEAVEVEESDDVPEGTILKEFVKGYRCGEHVIRAARVKVSKKMKKGE